MNTDKQNQSPGAAGSPKSPQAIYHGLFCVFFPGVASLFYGRIRLGLIVLSLMAVGGVMVYAFDSWYKTISIAMFLLAWVVSIVGGVINYADDPWSE